MRRIAGFVAAALLASGCGLVGSGMSKDANALKSSQMCQVTGPSLTAFQSSIYSFVRTNCAQCHGNSQTPLFASPNAATAASAMAGFVDFNTPSNSVLVEYAGNDHCGVGGIGIGGGGGCNGSGQSGAALQDITSWAATPPSNCSFEGGTTGTGLTGPSASIQYFSAPLLIPQNIPQASVSGNKFTVLQWDISNLVSGFGVTKAIFEAQIQFLDSNYYQLVSPKIAVQGSGLVVQGIHVLIKKTSDSGNGQEFQEGETWTSVNALVQPSPIPTPVPSPLGNTRGTVVSNAPATVPVPDPSPSPTDDQLVIGFESFGPPSVTITTGTNGTDGTFLVDGSNRSLYLYTVDTQNSGVSNCNGGCATAWPPLLLASGETVSATSGANQAMIGTITRSDGTTQITYNGWPLYYYASDTAPGQTNGQNSGGVWFLVTTAGAQAP